MNPSDYGLHHESFRTHQLESIEWCLALGSQIGIVESPTGSGKTCYPKAVSSQHPVTSLVKTKALQMENYGHLYDFDVLYGRNNYECIHKDGVGRMASDCLFSEVGMHRCPRMAVCPYMKRKAFTMASDRRALNYAYFMVAQWPRRDDLRSTYLFCDECHEVVDLVIEHSGIHISNERRLEWELPTFPRLVDLGGTLTRPPGYVDPVKGAMAWLGKCQSILQGKYRWLSQRAKDDKYRKQARRCEYFGMKLTATMSALTLNPNDWFIQSGPTVGRTRDGRLAPGLTAKPLTARHHAPAYLGLHDHTVLMSATVGNFDTLAYELGVRDYESRCVPSLWPPETRPVYVFEDAPKLGHKKSGPDEYAKQADIIVKCILGCPPEWAGIIHVTSKKEAPKLAHRLAKRGLQDRVVVIPQLPTDKQMAWWMDYRQKVPGAILISWSWFEGVDLGEERICISAKTPFCDIGSPYEKARMKYSRRMFYQRAAWKLEQSLGRTRRGRAQDYDTDGQHNGFVAIVDQNWTRIKKYLSEAFRESIVEYPKGTL